MLISRLKSIITSQTGSRTSNDAVTLYLELMKACLTNRIYDDDLDLRMGAERTDPVTGKISCVAGVAADPKARYAGYIWPSRAHTMIGVPRLENLQRCVETVIAEGIAGDFIETGAWRGGACIFMRAVLKAHGITDRTVWVADSFEGLPEADAAKHPYDHGLGLHQYVALAVPLEEVRKNFERYGLLDSQVRFLKGWFRDTLPKAPIQRLALLRVDGDHYESTMDALTSLYPKLSPGAYVIIDDYGIVQGTDLAVADFRRQQGIAADIELIPGGGAFWRRS